jgi:hypothetical protein
VMEAASQRLEKAVKGVERNEREGEGP